MTYRSWAPHPALRQWVSCYWELVDSDPGERQAIFPDGAHEIVWHRVDPPLQRSGRRLSPQPGAFLLGDVDTPVHLSFQGAIDCVGVRFRPGGLAAFVPMPITELAHAVHDLGEVFPGLSHAADRIRQATGPILVELLDGLLRVGVRSRSASQVASLCRLLEESAAHGSVSVMARAAGVSMRQIQRRMGAVLGIPPKRMLRVLRFREALRALLAGNRDAALGHYYDQAHLLRDFRDFAGGPPTVVFAQDLALNRSLHLPEGPSADATDERASAGTGAGRRLS